MTYKIPLKDVYFVSNKILNMPQHYEKFSSGKLADPELVEAVYSEAAKFCENELAPINQSGDEEGCHFDSGEVTTPTGFKAAYDQFVANGWPSLTAPQKYGGQGLPESIGLNVMEMMISCNHSWSMYPGLSAGALKTIRTHATDILKARYLPPMVEGKWTGTMCLTEPHCGSDLGLLKSSAEEDASSNEQGVYRITGSKIFISSGEHDMADNIIHIVLARLPGAPEGIKGISLFMVPKFLVNGDGSLGGRNTVTCGSIEEKMGIHGNSTCVMNFDGALGYLISAPNKGMRAMFTFINESRLGVAMHGQAHTSVSFQKALAYAKDRVQFKATKRPDPEKPADAIIHHADVRRMLLTQKAFAEGGRMLNMFCGQQVDIENSSDFSDKERHHADALLAILTPIAKGFLSEVSMEATNYGIQILGGHGYIKEWGLEQEVRDARISQLYEGTTGIQGLDLLGRKILKTRGAALEPLYDLFDDFLSENRWNKYGRRFKPYYKELKSITRSIGFKVLRGNLDELNAAAVEYLMIAGYVTLGYFWSRVAVIADEMIDNNEGEEAFNRAKIQTADFYFERIITRVDSLVESIGNGADSLMAMNQDDFIFLDV